MLHQIEFKNLLGAIQELENLAGYLKYITMKMIKKMIATLYKSYFFSTRIEDTVAELRAKILTQTGQESPPFYPLQVLSPISPDMLQ